MIALPFRVITIATITVACTARAVPAHALPCGPSTYPCPPITDLGTLGGSSSVATAVNANGRVVGTSTLIGDTETHGFSWTPEEGMIDLGTLGGTFSSAETVNDQAQVVGRSSLPGDAPAHAYLWTPVDGMMDLGTLGGSYSNALAVTPNGTVVGDSLLQDETTRHAFLWTRDAGMIDLGTLGGTFSAAIAVNANEQVIGSSTLDGDAMVDGFSWTVEDGMLDLGNVTVAGVNSQGQIAGYNGHPLLWSPGSGWLDLGTAGNRVGWALSLNDSGQVAGQIYDPSPPRGFTWTPGDGIRFIPPIGPGNSSASNVNNAGQVIGWSELGGPCCHGYVWSFATGTIDLGQLGDRGLFMSIANALNDSGQIVGSSQTNFSPPNFHAVVWHVSPTLTPRELSTQNTSSR